MKFHLTYQGRLESNGSAKHKHEIRKAFHPQLKRLWETQPNLSHWESYLKDPFASFLDGERNERGDIQWPESNLPVRRVVDILAEQFSRNGYRFVPLTMERASLIAGLDILFLRSGAPGSVIQSGDIDNRLKTLFDSLRMPKSKEELGGFDTPGDGEDPFYVLLEDDRLINHVSVQTDGLLEPTGPAAGPNDARLVLSVHLRPYAVGFSNLLFA